MLQPDGYLESQNKLDMILVLSMNLKGKFTEASHGVRITAKEMYLRPMYEECEK